MIYGRYTYRHNDGRLCCTKDDPNDLCALCQATHRGGSHKPDCPHYRKRDVSDARGDWKHPYARDLAKLRAANATALSRFEERWKAERLAALEAEYANI